MCVCVYRRHRCVHGMDTLHTEHLDNIRGTWVLGSFFTFIILKYNNNIQPNLISLFPKNISQNLLSNSNTVSQKRLKLFIFSITKQNGFQWQIDDKNLECEESTSTSTFILLLNRIINGCCYHNSFHHNNKPQCVRFFGKRLLTFGCRMYRRTSHIIYNCYRELSYLFQGLGKENTSFTYKSKRKSVTRISPMQVIWTEFIL